MNRRGFFGLVIGSITAAITPKPKITPVDPFVDLGNIFIASPRQMAYIDNLELVSLYGIPYHENNATSETWLGIERS